MRIGIIGDAIDRQYAGIHYFTKNLVQSLIKIDKENEYFLFKERESDDLTGMDQVVLPPRNWPFYRVYRIFRQIPKAAQTRRLDIVIEPAHFGPFNLAKSVKRITVIHDLTPILYPKWHPFISGLLQKLFLPRIAKRADLIITNSNYTKSDIVEKLNIDSEKIIVAHLGISKIFRPTEDKRTLGKYGIFKNYLLFQGTIEPRKNLINLIRGFELYRHAHPESSIQLIISGKKGWKSDAVFRRKNDSFYRDDIILLGYVKREHMPAIYTAAELFIYPSLYEGFGMPLLEALACGTRVASSKYSSLPEVGGRFVNYFNPHDIQDISSTIHFSLDQTEENKEDQISYASKFKWSATADKILVALKKIH